MALVKNLSTPNSNQIGQNAEQLALEYLLDRGLKLITKNYSCRYGEIDLIMQEPASVVFVEVRFRKHTGFGSGAESVDHRKQLKLSKSAECFLQRNKQYTKFPCRIDVISIGQKKKTAAPDIDWIRNAIET